MKFSTRDRDNDNDAYYHCGRQDKSGWWFNGCSAANLNGHYYSAGVVVCTIRIFPFFSFSYFRRADDEDSNSLAQINSTTAFFGKLGPPPSGSLSWPLECGLDTAKL